MLFCLRTHNFALFASKAIRDLCINREWVDSQAVSICLIACNRFYEGFSLFVFCFVLCCFFLCELKWKWQLWHCTWSRGHLFKCCVPGYRKISSWHKFFDFIDRQTFQFYSMEDFFMSIKQLKPFGCLQVNFSLFKKKLWPAHCVFSVPFLFLFPVMCLFSENSIRISKQSCYTFAITFILLDMKKTNGNYKCGFHRQVIFQNAPI